MAINIHSGEILVSRINFCLTWLVIWCDEINKVLFKKLFFYQIKY